MSATILKVNFCNDSLSRVDWNAVIETKLVRKEEDDGVPARVAQMCSEDVYIFSKDAGVELTTQRRNPHN